MPTIKENIKKILSELPKGMDLVAAAKSRSIDEILEAIDSGIKIIGENYVQEAEKKFNAIGKGVSWHLIGSLQRNKVKKAVRIFDMIETIDSMDIAKAVDKACTEENKTMNVLVEVNSGREKNKSGILPEDLEKFIIDMPGFKNLRVSGLMTMGPLLDSQEEYRPYFKEVKRLFESIKSLKL